MAKEFDDVLDFSDMTEQYKIVKMPSGKKYMLKEASGAATAAWRNAQLSGVTMSSEGKPVSLGAVGNLQLVLLCKCIYDEKGDNLIPAEEISKIPDRFLMPMYDWVTRVSELVSTAKTPEEVSKEAKAQQETAKND